MNLIARADTADALGKARGENFPVALRLLGKRRHAVLAFYMIARTADDVADAPDLDAATKLARLARIDADLAMGHSDDRSLALAIDRLDGASRNCLRRLLVAFRADARNERVRTYDDLLAYCRSSADPVGRFLLHLHGEDDGAVLASDALCTTLQILNHLQDAGDDWRKLRRLYLPAEWLVEAGAASDMLLNNAAPPPLRAVLDRLTTAVGVDLLPRAATLPGLIRSRGLRVQAAVTLAAARRLHARLTGADPVAARVGLTRADRLKVLLAGPPALFYGRRA